jgi:hypothetical protein
MLPKHIRACDLIFYAKDGKIQKSQIEIKNANKYCSHPFAPIYTLGPQKKIAMELEVVRGDSIMHSGKFSCINGHVNYWPENFIPVEMDEKTGEFTGTSSSVEEFTSINMSYETYRNHSANIVLSIESGVSILYEKTQEVHKEIFAFYQKLFQGTESSNIAEIYKSSTISIERLNEKLIIIILRLWRVL